MKKNIFFETTKLVSSILALTIGIPIFFATTSCSIALNPNYVWITAEHDAILHFNGFTNYSCGVVSSYPNISVSDDYGLTWFNPSIETGESFTIRSGKSIAIKGNNPNGFNQEHLGVSISVNTPTSSPWYETNEIKVSGNLMALIDNGSGSNYEIPSPFCFQRLFSSSAITDAYELKMPETPSTIDDPTKCPEYCFYSMFSGCNKLKKAPILPAKTLWKNCYDSMFFACRKLVFLQVGFTDWKEDLDATVDWMRDVKTSGTFVCPQELEERKHDDIQLPNYVYKDWTYQRVNFRNCPFDYFVFNKQDL